MYKVGIIGAKNSGKTTLIEKLIMMMSKQNIKIMTIKHTSHHHNFDTEGKDSYRHRNSGAQLTLAVNPSEFALYSENNADLLNEIENIVADRFDICLIEGDKFSGIPKILLTRNIEKIEIEKIKNICATYGESDLNKSNRHFLDTDIDQLSSFIIKQAGNELSGSLK